MIRLGFVVNGECGLSRAVFNSFLPKGSDEFLLVSEWADGEEIVGGNWRSGIDVQPWVNEDLRSRECSFYTESLKSLRQETS